MTRDDYGCLGMTRDDERLLRLNKMTRDDKG